MNQIANWKKAAAALAIAALMINSYGASAQADEAQSEAVEAAEAVEGAQPIEAEIATEAAPVEASPAADASYPLTDKLAFQVKTVVNESVPGGTRIGVVVKLVNNGAAVVRVPEYELRAGTAEGISYTLQPSNGNPKSIQPMAETELSYLSVIDRTDDVKLAEVIWTDVDYYVYPKQETLVVSAPLTRGAWKGRDTVLTDPASLRQWSDTFQIPFATSPIQYTPAGINKESTDKGTVFVVRLLATNPGSKRETVPDFMIDGKSVNKIFAGARVEQEPVVLEANEQKYIHYAIPTDQDTALVSLNVLTKEQFASAGGAAPIQYEVGRLNIALPGGSGAEYAAPYQFGEPMTFDNRSELIHPDMQVSVVEMTMGDNTEEGSKQITAKFRLNNKSDRPMPVPVFQAGLVGSDGYEYAGRRQAVSTDSVLPNSSKTVSYSFTLPSSETGGNLTLKVQDSVAAAPYRTTIAAYRVALQDVPTSDAFSLYPFDVKVEHWDISYMFNPATLQYSYKGKFILDMKRQEAIQVDSSFSHLQFELYDGIDRLIGTSVKSVVGQERLISGENNLTFNGTSEQFDYQLNLKIFEVFKTETGEAKRLVAHFSK